MHVVFMPFQIGTLPVQPPFTCGSHVLDLRDGGVGYTNNTTVSWAALEQDNIVALDIVFETQLTLELGPASASTESADDLANPFQFDLVESHGRLGPVSDPYDVSYGPARRGPSTILCQGRANGDYPGLPRPS